MTLTTSYTHITFVFIFGGFEHRLDISYSIYDTLFEELCVSYTYDVTLSISYIYLIHLMWDFEYKLHLSYSFDVSLSASYICLIHLMSLWVQVTHILFFWCGTLFEAELSSKHLLHSNPWGQTRSDWRSKISFFLEKCFHFFSVYAYWSWKVSWGKRNFAKKLSSSFCWRSSWWILRTFVLSTRWTKVKVSFTISIWILFNFCSLKRHIFNDLLYLVNLDSLSHRIHQ